MPRTNELGSADEVRQLRERVEGALQIVDAALGGARLDLAGRMVVTSIRSVLLAEQPDDAEA